MLGSADGGCMRSRSNEVKPTMNGSGVQRFAGHGRATVGAETFSSKMNANDARRL